MRNRIERTRSGDYRVRLGASERQVLASLPGQLRELLDEDDPSLVRLFPRAYDDDAAADEYDRLVRGELTHGKREALRVLEETADNEQLTQVELERWLGAVEDLRLVLGTQLDVTEEDYGVPLDPTDDDAHQRALYGWLSWLQEEIVAALSASLP